ncbi:Histidine protein kinase DivJ [Methyloligella halotolerans]|uniref:histidine kinase n=2 Tax=Methyloligella halotolerans TaxID=1177755 RepID=A0A1E2RX95_9HYPH|nr:Histidine protein kinase DivJ [Methyloligella halotolerans]
MKVMSIKSLRGFAAYFASLVHETVRDDPLTAARHQTFIAQRILAGLLALCVFPVYLVLAGKPSLLGALVFLWFLTPIALAYFVSRTGKLQTAHLISAINFAGLITFSAWLTGGISSFLLPWLVVVPIEAALASNRRVVLWSMLASLTGVIVLAAGSGLGAVPPAHPFPFPQSVLMSFGLLTAALYGAGIALSVQLVHRKSDDFMRMGEERYRLLAENATDMITRHDERGRVIFASLASQQLLGAPASVLAGNGLFERVHVADRPAYLTALSRAQIDNQPMAVEFRLRRQGDSGPDDYIWAEMRCRPVRQMQGDGAARSVVAITRDISERKAQEAELLRARDSAESASRAKTQFLANMSHELRTPLNAVIGFSEILSRELFGRLGEDRYRDYARLIHESGGHLLNVVNDILDMSKIEAGKFNILKEPFDVGTLLKSCVDIVGPTAEQKSLSLEVEMPVGMPELLADKRACKQMLLNVLSNAIKFTDEGGRVHLSAHEVDGAVHLRVRDTGIGIAEKDLPNLGNPFVQADNSYDRSYDGAGLGLSVVKGLARLHGGRLEIESQLGEGTTVTVILPKAECRLPAEPIETEKVETATAA